MIELLANWLVGGAGSPKSVEHLIACGYVSKEHYRLLLDRTQIAVGRKQKQYEQIVTRTIEHETEIVIVARELGLNPEPSGLGLTLWKAICPSASHGLHISTHRDQFFCGYCSVTGGIDELRQFVKESKRDKDKRIKKSPPTTQLQDELGPRIVEPTKEAMIWYEKNRWYGDEQDQGNLEATQYAYFQHYNLINEGHEPDSNEYYQELNNRVYKVYPHLRDANADNNDEQSEVKPAARGSKKRRPDEDVIRVVYGIYEFEDFEDGQVIAIKESEAIRRATNIEVLHTARTWAEVKAHLPPEDFSLLCEQFEGDDILFDADGNELEEPPGETVFDRQFIESEYGFDTWYIDQLADMAQWIPDEIQRIYGHLDSGGMGVDTQLSLDPKFEDQIRSELAAHGYWAVRDDDLVSATFEWEEGKLDEIIKGRTAAK